VWWTDDFQHFYKDKGFRFGEDHVEEVLPGLTMRWVHSPAYEKNMSYKRFASHKICVKRMESQARGLPRPDLILSSFPADVACDMAVRLGTQWNVPTVLDVGDLWPDVFFQGHLPRILNPLLKVLTFNIARRARRSLAGATAIIGNTPEFVEWGLCVGKRTKTDLDRAFPIGYQHELAGESLLCQAEQFWAPHGIAPGDGKFRAAFLGAFSSMYDLKTVFRAAEQCPQVEFVLCGDGPQLDGFQRKAATLGNVICPGRINKEQIQVLLQNSSLGLLPYIDTHNFRANLPNKPGEYLAFSLPILSSIPGRLGNLLTQYDCGGVYDSSESLTEMLSTYQRDAALLARHRSCADRLFADVFDATAIYTEMTRHLETIVQDFKPAD
jgi:glycosyltransferase involved in cell wall biosynthesis